MDEGAPTRPNAGWAPEEPGPCTRGWGFGPRRDADGVELVVYAPERSRVEAVLYARDGARALCTEPLERVAGGFFRLRWSGAERLLYKLRLDGEGPFPDPASRSQPFGVHGPSEVMPWWPPEPAASPHAGWTGVPIEEMVIYELHVGTATPAGTFDGLVERLGDVARLGVNTLELMPVGSFPGRRGWGYDGAFPFAPHAAYGGPAGLLRLVRAAHHAGLAVILDVVYNHFGPDGSYIGLFAPNFFAPERSTPWGAAIDFTRPEVRAFFVENARMWIRDYELDGLRLDATHAIHDEDTPGRPHVLRAVAEAARAAAPDRHVVVIAEDDRNERRLVAPVSRGGYALDAVWADDLHHALRRALAGDADGYYRDYAGTAAEIAKAISRGWIYQGERSAHRGRPRGTPTDGLDPTRFVHCLQNHDQVGNRALGDRLGASVEPAAFRAASALLLLSPHVPLLFMGQEWNASTPFQYFTDHEPALGDAVRRGRRAEFARFEAFSGAGADAVPDPQSPSTFERSRLRWSEREEPAHAGVLALYEALLGLRRDHPALRPHGRFAVEPLGERALALRRRHARSELLAVVNLGGALDAPLPAGPWQVLLHTEEPRFGGRAGRIVVRDCDEGRAPSVRLDGPGAVVLARESR